VIVKLTLEQLALVGATNETDFAEKLTAYCANVKKLETSMSTLTDDNSALVARLKAVEDRPVMTAEQVKQIATEASSGAVTLYLASDAGKGLIKAEASNVFLQAHAGTGTQPLKPSPAPADPANKAQELLAAGDFEAAYAASKDLQAEFPTAKVFVAYARAEKEGRVKLNIPRQPANN